MKRFAVSAFARSPLPSLFHRFTRQSAAIFMLHRFADPDLGVPGHDVDQLRRQLAWLRRRKYRIADLRDVVRELAENPTGVERTIALTVDDGYDDFRRIGWPVLAEFDCPVTVFLTVDFTDGKLWFWWDRVEFALANMQRGHCAIRWADRAERLEWTTGASLRAVCADVVEKLKVVSERERLDVLSQIVAQSDAAVPDTAPAQYAPMQWSAIRRLGEMGVTFGPHSMTHPILSRTDDAQSAWEIDQSWSRIRSETAAAVPIFCYPNGRPQDYSVREMQSLQRLNFSAAVTTRWGYAHAGHFAADRPQERYAVPRFPWSDSTADVVQVASGFERMKSLLRGG